MGISSLKQVVRGSLWGGTVLMALCLVRGTLFANR